MMKRESPYQKAARYLGEPINLNGSRERFDRHAQRALTQFPTLKDRLSASYLQGGDITRRDLLLVEEAVLYMATVHPAFYSPDHHSEENGRPARRLPTIAEFESHVRTFRGVNTGDDERVGRRLALAIDDVYEKPEDVLSQGRSLGAGEHGTAAIKEFADEVLSVAQVRATLPALLTVLDAIDHDSIPEDHELLGKMMTLTDWPRRRFVSGRENELKDESQELKYQMQTTLAGLADALGVKIQNNARLDHTR